MKLGKVAKMKIKVEKRKKVENRENRGKFSEKIKPTELILFLKRSQENWFKCPEKSLLRVLEFQFRVGKGCP